VIKIGLEIFLMAGYNSSAMKKKHRVATANKRTRSGAKPYPDNDPEWDNLEERYSRINDDMHKLAQLLAQQ